MPQTEVISDRYSFVLSKLKGVIGTGKSRKACCPAHNDEKQSLSITEGDDGKILLHCHAGCEPRAIIDAAGLKWADLMPEKVNSSPEPSTIKCGRGRPVMQKIYTSEEIKKWKGFEKGYAYKDKDGKNLFLVVRKDNKKFVQLKSIGPDKWELGTKGIELIPYCISDVIKAVNNGEPIYIPAGEKDVETCRGIGLTATTNPQGEGKGKWKQDYNKYFKDATVRIFPDNDETGEEHALEVASSLHGIAKEIRIVRLPRLLEKEDVSDFLQKRDGTKEELLRLVEDAPIWEPEGISQEQSPLAKPYKPCDQGNSQRFNEHFGHKAKWCAATGWLYYDDEKWREDEVKQIKEWGKQVSDIVETEAKREGISQAEQIALKKISLDLCRNGKIEAMLSMSESSLAIDFSEFDRSKLLLNCKNGTLDLETGRLYSHRNTDLITKLVNVNYDPDARCDLWMQFLRKIMNNDEEMINYLQRAVGYTLTGEIKEEVFFWLLGPGGNGKSTFIETLFELLGNYATAINPKLLVGKDDGSTRFSKAELRGARYVQTTEVSGGSFNKEVIQSLTGGDSILAEKKGKDPFVFRPELKLWFSCNTQPHLKNADFAFRRRLQLIDFDVTISEEDKKAFPDCKARLKKQSELRGILAWAVRGCKQSQKSGLQTPDKVKRAADEYMSSQDVFERFFQFYFKKASKRDFITSEELIKTHKQWAVDEGEIELSNRELADKLIHVKKCSKDKICGQRVWRNIARISNTTNNDGQLGHHGHQIRNDPENQFLRERSESDVHDVHDVQRIKETPDDEWEERI